MGRRDFAPTKWIVPVLLCAALLVTAGCHPQRSVKQREYAVPHSTAKDKNLWPNGVVGYYVIDDQATKHTANDLPPGQVMYLYIGESCWLQRDMMIGYEGTCALKPGGATLTVLEGPAGPIKKKEECEVALTKNGIALKLAEKPALTIQFKYVGKTAPEDFGFDEVLAKHNRRTRPVTTSHSR